MLLLLTLGDEIWWRQWGLTNQGVFSTLGLAIVLFLLGWSYDLLQGATPVLRMWRVTQKEQVLLKVEVGDVQSYLQNLGRDLIYALFGANLVWISLDIPSVRYAGLLLGGLLAILHALSMGLLLAQPDLMSLLLTPKDIIYFENIIERIDWGIVRRVECADMKVQLVLEDDEHEIDFANEPEDLQEVCMALKRLCLQHNIPFTLSAPTHDTHTES